MTLQIAGDPDTDDASEVYLPINNGKEAGLNRYTEDSEDGEIRDKEDKRRLGSAFNVGRGSFYKSLATKQGTSKKHNMDDLTPELEITSRVGRRNLGSAMNLLKFRNPMRMGFSGQGQGRGRRRIASAINLKKIPSN